MNMDTLILNKDGNPLSLMPLSTVSWHRAMQLISLDKVQVLKYHESWYVNSASERFQVPSVLLLKDYLKWNRKVQFSRQNVYLRDNYTCGLCNQYFGPEKESLLTLDHVLPRSKGGVTCWNNISTACYRCNVSKSDNEKIKPKIMPYKPTYYELVAKRKNYAIIVGDDDWVPYLGWDPSLIKLKHRRYTND